MSNAIDTIPIDAIPADVYASFRDVRCYLANLYKFILSERPHLKTKKGIAAVEATKMVAVDFVNDVNLWHTWLVTYMLLFQELKWKNINYECPPPKMSDITFLSLMKHKIFAGEDIKTITDTGFKLTTAERKTLKDFALRVTA